MERVWGWEDGLVDVEEWDLSPRGMGKVQQKRPRDQRPRQL